MNRLDFASLSRLACAAFFGGSVSFLRAEEYAVPEKGKTVSVACQEFPAYTYDVLVPENYEPAKPCAILYTFSPGGGGMVRQHEPANEVTPTIVVGIRGSKNGVPEREFLGEIYAVLQDTHERFNIDPAAQYCGGLSGGAVVAYTVARQSKYVCGVIASGGWLSQRYAPIYVYPRGLMVARITGIDDRNALGWMKQDGDQLCRCGCKVKDLSQPGGHLMGTPESVRAAMKWLTAAKAPDKTAASADDRAKKWESSPYSTATLKEMLDAIRNDPRSQLGNAAIRQFMRIMKDDAQFCKAAMPAAASDDLASFFGYLAYGAALAKDSPRLKSAAYALDRVCPDRKNRWRACAATLLLFSEAGCAGAETIVPKYIGSPTQTPGLPPFHRAVYAAALLKSGKRFEAAPVIAKLPSKTDDAKLAAAIADLKKNAGGNGAMFDSQVWISVLDEDNEEDNKR